MEIIPVSDPRFRAYGQVLEGYDFSPLIEAMERTTPAPGDGTVYVASDPALSLPPAPAAETPAPAPEPGKAEPAPAPTPEPESAPAAPAEESAAPAGET